MRWHHGVPSGVTLFADVDGVVHLPHLVRGRLISPPQLSRAEVCAAVERAPTGVVRWEGAQIVPSSYGSARFFVVPDVSGLDLVCADAAVLACTAQVPLDAIIGWLQRTAAALVSAPESAGAVALLQADAPYPAEFFADELAGFLAGLAPESLRSIVDTELGHRGVPGAAYLDGWVPHPVEAFPEPGASAGRTVAVALHVDDHHDEPMGFALRAMPTRQLHVTAGNSPLGPLVSVLRLALSKGVGVVKMAAGSLVPGGLLALALASADAGDAAPLQRELSVVYWPGGDERVERVLLAPGVVDRIVVWGDTAAVSSLRARAPMTRIVSFDPRYGVSLIGREAFASPAVLADVVARAAADVCLHDQKACNSSHIQYVEGTDEEIAVYAAALREALRAWDVAVPPLPRVGLDDDLTDLRRGRLAMADWYPSETAGTADVGQSGWSSGVVVSKAAFDILTHPLARFVVVRPVSSLRDEALAGLSRHVSSAGVWPEFRRLDLRTEIAARGVSSVLPLGRAEHTAAGAPHDGVLALQHLVDWARS